MNCLTSRSIFRNVSRLVERPATLERSLRWKGKRPRLPSPLTSPSPRDT